MRKLIRLLAILVFVGALVVWLAAGANPGWTKTSEAVMTLDEVTGIEGISYQPRFAPGLDFLGAALLGTAVMAGISIMFQKTTKQNKTKT